MSTNKREEELNMGEYSLKVRLLDSTDEALKRYYHTWKQQNIDQKFGFAAIDSKFYDNNYLADLESGPLKLYLFFCFKANNDNGTSWHSIQAMANYFDTQTRTINNWIKVLVEKDLIYRDKTEKRSHTTYLLPFSTTIMEHKLKVKKDKTLEEAFDLLIQTVQDQERVFGKIFKVHHIFQWKKDKSDHYANLQYLLIITKRNNGVLIGHMYNIRRYCSDLTINTLNLHEHSYFESNLSFQNERLIGVALKNKVSLDTNSGKKNLLMMIEEDLSTMNPFDFTERPFLEYGDFVEFFEEKAEQEKEEE